MLTAVNRLVLRRPTSLLIYRRRKRTKKGNRDKMKPNEYSSVLAFKQILMWMMMTSTTYTSHQFQSTTRQQNIPTSNWRQTEFRVLLKDVCSITRKLNYYCIQCCESLDCVAWSHTEKQITPNGLITHHSAVRKSKRACACALTHIVLNRMLFSFFSSCAWYSSAYNYKFINIGERERIMYSTAHNNLLYKIYYNSWRSVCWLY